MFLFVVMDARNEVTYTRAFPNKKSELHKRAPKVREWRSRRRRGGGVWGGGVSLPNRGGVWGPPTQKIFRFCRPFLRPFLVHFDPDFYYSATLFLCKKQCFGPLGVKSF